MNFISVDAINLGAKLITNETDEKIVSVNDASFSLCPSCKSTNFSVGSFEDEQTIVYRVNKCLDCKTEWEERFDLVQVRITK